MVNLYLNNMMLGTQHMEENEDPCSIQACQ